MPTRVSMWACYFRCGRVSTKKDSIEKHEPTCFLNPARRACKTCRHEKFFDADGMKSQRHCMADADLGVKGIQWDCGLWEAK
jgi:hypothetical protein